MGAEGLNAEKRESEIPITHRQAVRHDLPIEWVDGLLIASCAIRPEATPREAVEALVAVAVELIPDAAIAVRFSDGSGGQTIVRRSPREGSADATDPQRLFPELAHERLVPLTMDEGTTLHFGSDDESCFSGQGLTEGFIDRFAMSVGAALRNARLHETSRKQRAEVAELEAQVIQSSKLASLGQVAAGIVHELNNPLTSIIAYSGYLHGKAQRGGADPADIERLARIKEAADRILAFSRDLVAYSRPSSTEPVPVSINEVVERALVFCDHVLEELHVEVERDLGDVGDVLGISSQLTQVFVNLFTNAAHAMREEGGRLAIKTELLESADAVRISIRDEGHGISDANLERIFDPYFTTKPDGLGSGLGLSIVRNIVVSHGGKIRARAHPLKGAVFEVELPVHAHRGEDPG